MGEKITEWEFTADVASWINEILEKNPDLPFIRAKCEMRGSGSKKRRDLTLLARNRKVALSGEVKLPYVLEGSTPYRESVVMDARRKAARANSPFFFTWNVNELVLWQTFQADTERPDPCHPPLSPACSYRTVVATACLDRSDTGIAA